MKLPISFAFLRSHVDREIDPLASRGSLEFQVPLGQVWIGSEENLANVAVPKPECFLCCLRCCTNNQRLCLIADIANVQSFFGPDESGFGLSAHRGFCT